MIPQVTLESRARLDLEDFQAYLAFQDPQDQLASKETGDLLETLDRQVLERRDLRVQRGHLDHLDRLESASQGFKASGDLLGKLVRKSDCTSSQKLHMIPVQVGVVCPVVLDPLGHLAIVSFARLSRCKQMLALRRRVEDGGRSKREKPNKARSQTKTAYRLLDSYCSIKPLIKFTTMTFSMMVILKRVFNTATEVTKTEVFHPAVFIQYLLLRLILVTSWFK